MKQSFKYTILTLFLALIFVFGSMAGMNYILKARERQILSESGRVVVEAPVRAWQKQDDSEDRLGETKEQENGENSNQGKYVLTAKQMEDVISYWNDRLAVTVHHPVDGQISMGEAVEAGETWLREMGVAKSGQETDMGTYSITATLGVAVQKEAAGAQLEPYYSFWTLQFSNQSVRAVLYLNAVTGTVWSAEIALYGEPPEKPSDDRLRLFAKLAGLQVSDDDSVVIDSGKTRTEIAIKESRLYAQETIYDTIKKYGNQYDSYKTISYCLLTK